MNVPNQDDLAWDLLDAARAGLDSPAVNRISMTLASADYAAAIEVLLVASVGSAVALPPLLHERLVVWLGFYAGHPREQRLQHLLEQVTINVEAE